MPQLLSVANKLLSLRGAITLTDENEQSLFEARGEFALFTPTWRLYKGATELASIRKRIWAWAPTWDIESVLGSFVIKRKLWAWSRQYRVIGGGFDGAFIKGSFFDFSAEVVVGGKLIAKAQGKILTLRDRHIVELLDQVEDSVLFTAIAMVVMQLDRKAAAAQDGAGT